MGLLPAINVFKAVKFVLSDKYYDSEKNALFNKGFIAIEDI